VTKVLATLLSALGLAYACLWWSFERFYGEFGVSPQDVGLAPSGSASDLSAAVLQLGVWLAIVLVVLALAPVGAVIAIEVKAAARAAAKVAGATPAAAAAKLRARVAAGAAALLLAVTGSLYWWLVDGWVGLALIAGAAILFEALRRLGRVIDLVPAPAGSGIAGLQGAVKVAMPRLAVSVALAAAIVGITFIDLPTDAAQAGKCAATESKSVPELNLPLPGLELRILSVHAQRATLTWLSGTAPAGVPVDTSVVYLGQANGNVVVYDPTSHASVHIPAGDVAVAVDAAARHCRGVH
jgi:hypothetical protein